MIAPQFVKPYVKSNDAEAICEAVQRPSMRFVSTQSIAQQDLQSLHRIRSQRVVRQAAQADQVRGLLTATALMAAIGDVSVFKNGRELAAWIGLVPKQHSTGEANADGYQQTERPLLADAVGTRWAVCGQSGASTPGQTEPLDQ